MGIASGGLWEAVGLSDGFEERLNFGFGHPELRSGESKSSLHAELDLLDIGGFAIPAEFFLDFDQKVVDSFPDPLLLVLVLREMVSRSIVDELSKREMEVATDEQATKTDSEHRPIQKDLLSRGEVVHLDFPAFL